MYRKSIHIHLQRKSSDTDLHSYEGLYAIFTTSSCIAGPPWSLDVHHGLFSIFSFICHEHLKRL